MTVDAENCRFQRVEDAASLRASFGGGKGGEGAAFETREDVFAHERDVQVGIGEGRKQLYACEVHGSGEEVSGCDGKVTALDVIGLALAR
jgi:hypothetical protein